MVRFSENGTNAAKNTTVTFSAAGTYTFQVTITDGGGLSTTSTVNNVQVHQTATSLVVSPAAPTVPEKTLEQFSGTELDQFGNAMSSQPGMNWSLSGSGSLSNQGLYLAPAATGSATITATAGPLSGNTTVSVGPPGPVSVPVGTETLVNTASTNGNQQLPAVAMDQSGNYVVVWEDDQNGGKVNAQRYNASGGAVGSQFQVNTAAAGGSPVPSVAMNAAGQFVVSWNGNGGKAFAKVFSAAGAALTGDIAISKIQGSSRTSVAIAANGSFNVVYEGNDTADNDGIYVQRYTAGGATSGTDVLVNTTTAGAQVNPSIATDALGNSVITWTEKSPKQTIKAALLPVSGAPSTEFLVGASGDNNDDNSSVAMDDSGNFVVAWAENGSAQGIYARRFNASGGALDSAPAQLSDPGAAQLTKPCLAVRPDGSYLVGWTANNLDGNGNGVFAQAFNPTGTASGGQFLVNTTTQGNQQDAATVWYDSHMVVAWDGQGAVDNNGVYFQVYSTPSAAPTVATPASGTPNPVTGKSTSLSALGADEAGQSSLTYTWATTGTTPAPVTFTVNGTNAAADTTANFTSAGSYNFQVTITNAAGLSVMSTVAVTVEQTLTTFSVSPATASLNENQTQQFTAVGCDQFGNTMSNQPALTWSVASGGVGSINSSGLYTASFLAGSATVTAKSGSVSGSASVVVDGGSSSAEYPPAQTTVENVPLTFSSQDGNPLSVGGSTSGIELSVYSGILTLASTSGLTFKDGTANGSKNVHFAGSIAALNAALNGLVFTPAVNFTGSDPLTFTPGITVLGLFTFSSTDTVPITVTPAAPTVAAPATANPSPVTGTTAALSVLGADDSGESNLTYSWVTTGTPPAAVHFSVDGTNAAKNTTATFSESGSYSFKVTVTNGSGLSVVSSVNVTVNQTLTTIAVSPANAALNENQTEQFVAFGHDQFGQPMATQPSFTWARASGVGSINSLGLYTAPSGTGMASITAASGTVSGSVSVTVTNAAPTVATAASATPGTVTGTTTAISAVGADDGGESNLTYTWATIGTPPAAVSYSSNGTDSAKNCTATFSKAGTYDLQVTITDAGGLSASSSVMVVVSQTLTAISVAPNPVTVTFNGTQQFTAVAYDQFGSAMGSQPTFSWNKSSGVGSINSTGLYSAPAGSGAATITGSSGPIMGTASVTVSNTAPTVATPASASITTVVGTSTNLSVLGADGGGETSLTYTWAATVKPVGPSPTFSANDTNAAKASMVTFNQAGSYVFQVTITNVGGATATSSVNVTVDQTLSGITLSPSGAGLNLNASEAFSATAYDQFTKPMSSQPGFNWSISSGVGSIDNSTGAYDSGPITGTAVVSATSGAITGTANVTVTNAAPTVVAAAAASPSPVTGTTAQLSVLGADDGGESNLTYEWAITGTAPASVAFSTNDNNTAKNTIATFTKSGVYDFLVTVIDSGGLTATSSVSVTVDQTVSIISVSPNTAELNENQTSQFTAAAYDQFGQLMESQPTFAWARASGVGSISGSGLYTAPYGTGVASITATSGLVSGSASIAVSNATPTIVIGAAASPNQVIGNSTSLCVLSADDGGEPNLTYTWSTVGTRQATVAFSVNGTNSAKNTVASFCKAGDYQFLVTITDAGGLSATSSVSVIVSQTPTSLAIAPASSTVVEGATQQFNAVTTDQFGDQMATPALSWAVTSGRGSVDSNGLFAAPSTSGTSTISASSGPINATATIFTPNEPPTAAVAASASPAVVTTTSTILSVLGADDGGESNLIYTWSNGGTTPAPASFSINGNNSAKNVAAKVSAVGSYDFDVMITDAQGLSVSSSVDVTVLPVASSLEINPPTDSVGRKQSAQFAATALDQFAAPLAAQPAIDWSVSGAVGSVNSTGLYTAPFAGHGTDVVAATSGNLIATAVVDLVDDLSATGPAVLSTAQDVPLVFAGGNSIVVSDADQETASVPVSVSIDATHGTVQISETNGLTFLYGAVTNLEQLTFSGAVADLDRALQSMTYKPDANFTGTGSVTITISETGSGGPSPNCATEIKVSAPAVPTPSGGIGQTGPAGSTKNSSQTNADDITDGSATSNTASESTSATTISVTTPAAVIDNGGIGAGISTAAAPVPHAPQPPAQPPQPSAKPAEHLTNQPAAQKPSNMPPKASDGNTATNSPQVNIPDVQVRTVPEHVFKFLAPKGEMARQMDAASKKLVSEKQMKIYAGSATVASFGASAAYLIWILRGGSLLSSLLTILPAWKSIDPLPVLDNFESRKRRKKRMKSDVESLESMVDKSNTESETTWMKV